MQGSTTTSSALPRRSVSLGQMVNKSTATLTVAIGAIILTLALLILFHQNANATKGYTLRALERDRRNLLLEEEVLNMQIAEAQALQKLHEDPVISLMLPPRLARYVEGEQTVARSVAELFNDQ
ncbi:hypothetical protein FJZ27_00885 [Candidatus Peribacteria bacterium]|nr:hypothetical protein [Candidatus Peribacteria bacterium]